VLLVARLVLLALQLPLLDQVLLRRLLSVPVVRR
jgi:hypothetical protein